MGVYILADNQELTRYAIDSYIRQDKDNIIYNISNKSELVKVLTEQGQAVIILDYKLFNFLDEDQLLIISERFIHAQWILLSDELTDNFIGKVIYSSNVFSVVYKECNMNEIKNAISSATAGRRYICQRAMEQLLSRQNNSANKPDILTSTEIEIVKAISQGKSTKEIASERFSSVHTITTHRKNIFRKLGVNTAHEVIKYALRAGMIDQSEFYI